MPDDATPDLLGFRLTLGDRVYDWRLGDMTARHTRALRLATTDPRDPSAAWTEQRVLLEITAAEVDGVVLYAAPMECLAVIAFLAMLQADERPDFDKLLDAVCGDLDASLVEIPEEEAALDPPV